jgi:alcohol dehydrogenase
MKALVYRATAASTPTASPTRAPVASAGSVADVGVHGVPVSLALQDLWILDRSITTGLLSGSSTPMLLRLVAEGGLDAAGLVTHEFGFEEIVSAYKTFGSAAETTALKVVIER